MGKSAANSHRHGKAPSDPNNLVQMTKDCGYNLHITLCKLKAYNVLIWYIYILQYDCHSSFS